MEEVNFQRTKRFSTKIYFILGFFLFLFIIGFTYNYLIKQIGKETVNQNLNFNTNLNSAAELISWKTINNNYNLKIPTSWFTTGGERSLLISSYNSEEKVIPEKRAKLEIQLVENPENLDPEKWWSGLYPDWKREEGEKEIVIDQEIGVKKINKGPGTNPLDLNYFIIVNHQKTIYVFTITTWGYSAKDYERILDEIIQSFIFAVPPPEPANLPLTNSSLTPTSTVDILSQTNFAYQNWQVYENKEQGFKIEYPPTWHIYNEGVVPGTDNYWQIIFEDKKYTGQEIERPYIAIGVLKNQNSLTEWFNLQKEEFSGTNLLYNENYKLNDYEGVMYSTGGLGLSSNFAMLFDNKIYRIWNLNFFPADDTLMIYFKMLDSFRLLPKE